MQEKHPLSEQLLLAVAILLGAGIVIVALVLAINPDIVAKPRYTPPPSKVRLEDYSLEDYSSLITVGTHNLPFGVYGPAAISSATEGGKR